MTTQLLADDLENRFLRLLLGWDNYERTRGGSPVVDFNVTGRGLRKRYGSRLEVLDELKALRVEVDRSGSTQLGLRLIAQEAYLRKLIGQHIALSDYTGATVGASCCAFENEYVEACMGRLRERLTNLGIAWSPSMENELEKLEPSTRAVSLDREFRRGLRRDREVLEAIIKCPVRFALSIEHVDTDAYWSYWVDSDRGRFRLRINGARPAPSASLITLFVHHELLSHCGQMSVWRKEIKAGRLERHHGATTVHGPEQFVLEGLAHTLPLWVDAERSYSQVLVSHIYIIRFKLMILHNIIIMSFRGDAIESCLDYATSLLPSINREWLVSAVSGASSSAQLRSYLLTYGPSVDYFLSLVEILTPPERGRLLREFYTRALYNFDLYHRFRSVPIRGAATSVGGASLQFGP